MGALARQGRLCSAIALAVTVAIAAWACGTSSPNSPSPVAGGSSGGIASLQLTPGPHLLLLTGNTFTGACSPIGENIMSIGLAPRVNLERDGSGWLVRAAPGGEGDLTLRFRASGADTTFAVGVTGSATGTLTDANSALGVPANVLLVIEGQAELSGQQVTAGSAPPILGGELRGPITFRGPAGPVTTCSRISWSLGPSRP
ncbi:MAG: hypothetical protein MUF60_03760 [Vicinamibacterales bacterium]|nr:hypothetical protein [Vicinamibacterales bacterium]